MHRSFIGNGAVVALCLAGGLCGCSGTLAPALAPPLQRTGVAPAFVSKLRIGTAVAGEVRPEGALPNFLAVSDFGTEAVEILNKHYRLKQRITKGLLGPEGVWYDAAGNLYVTNNIGANVQEYAKSAKTPAFTYSSGLKDPIAVTTDERNNVYVGDYNFGGAGYVNEYAKDSNTVVATCAPGGGAQGVAVNEAGDVFVAYTTSSNVGHVAEYVGGLTGCNETVFSVTLGFGGGLQIDNKNNLVVCDQGKGTVDIIAPPYTSITSSIGPFTDPLSLALNSKNTMIYIADVGNGDVVVASYPSGTTIATLGPSNGLSDPAGVAVSPPAK